MKRGLQDNKRAVGIVVGLYSLCLGGREAGGSSSVQSQLGLHSETLYQREKKKEKKRGGEGERGRRGGGENGEGRRRREGERE